LPLWPLTLLDDSLRKAIKRSAFSDSRMKISSAPLAAAGGDSVYLIDKSGWKFPASAGLSGCAGSDGYANRYPCEKQSK
jgi:hypothetical protein